MNKRILTLISLLYLTNSFCATNPLKALIHDKLPIHDISDIVISYLDKDTPLLTNQPPTKKNNISRRTNMYQASFKKRDFWQSIRISKGAKALFFSLTARNRFGKIPMS